VLQALGYMQTLADNESRTVQLKLLNELMLEVDKNGIDETRLKYEIPPFMMTDITINRVDVETVLNDKDMFAKSKEPLEDDLSR